MMQTVSVLLPIPTNQTYTYAVPDGMQVSPGAFVQVPLGPRRVIACVWDEAPDVVDPDKLRSIEIRYDCPPSPDEMRQFVDWVASYTMAPRGMILNMVLRSPGAMDPPAPVEAYKYSGLEPDRLTSARSKVLALARDGASFTKSGMAHAAGVSASVVGGLIELGCLEKTVLTPGPILPAPDPSAGILTLSPDQQSVADSLKNSVGSGFGVSLIDGVTGSGKTEVYFEAVAAVLEKGRQALILLPEIALTASFLERFEKRFGTMPAEWHSGLSPKKREQVWRQVLTGELRVVVGARSALFLPFAELGLIIVDEEHDGAYKQEDRVIYNARDMAIVRGRIADFPVILASATPSIESRVNADAGRYNYHIMESRFGDAVLPDLHAVDMRVAPPRRGKFISPVLLKAVSAALEKKRQSLLFLNRRGYAPLTLCRVCGHRFQCRNCTAWLVEHRFRGLLQCHHCGHGEPVPEACPECGTLDHLAACGPGVERIAEEIIETFPEARTLVFSSDLMGGARRLQLEFEAVANGECDIVIGTQLVAKGHHFPLMEMVGVVDADIGLANGDPRAAERTFQLMSQVTGRAGRTGGKSAGFLQTYQPEHPVIQAIVSGDREAFYEREIELRRQASLPPFGRLAAVIVSAASRKEAADHARAMRRCAPEKPEISLLGPAEAPLAIVRERHRFRLLVHSQSSSRLHAWFRKWLEECPKEKGSVRVQIDIDPMSFV